MDTYEKKYKNALEWARQVMNGETGFIRKEVEEVFPELKESEDERIKRVLVEFFKSYKEQNICGAETFNGIPTDNILAWLEKQGSQNLANSAKTCKNESFDYENANIQQKDFAPKVEPKFKVGDFIVNDYCMGKVIELTDDAYLLDTEQGIPFSCEHNVHLWTIADANDGDVLVTDSGRPFIFKGCVDERHPNSPVAYCGILADDSFCIADGIGWWTSENVYPATKEQRAILFLKMFKAGYEWDAEKKKFKGTQRLISVEAKEETYIKLNWSEEDERNLQGVIDEIEANKSNAPDYDLITYDRFISWLKSLKERYTWKPSERMLEALKLAKCEFHPDCSETMEQLKYLYQELKQLYYDRT